MFKALANEKRLQLLRALRESECCVCERQVVLDAPQSTVATHLRTLKEASLVRSRKKLYDEPRRRRGEDDAPTEDATGGARLLIPR